MFWLGTLFKKSRGSLIRIYNCQNCILPVGNGYMIIGFMITKDLEVRLGSEVKVDRFFFFSIG